MKRKQSSRSDLFARGDADIAPQNKTARGPPTAAEHHASIDENAPYTASPRTSRRRELMNSPSQGESQDEDEGTAMQRVVEQIQLANKSKTHKYRAKMEVVVDDGLKKVEAALANALREEETTFRTTLTQLHGEFKRVTQGLQQWSQSLHQLNESYHLSMKGLSAQFDKLTRGFSDQLKAVSRDALAPEAGRERRERVHRECRALTAQVRQEIQSAPEPAKGNAQTAMLLQALVNSMNS